jgi:hypothetical protein
MQCAFCGATLEPGTKTCSQCGAEVGIGNPNPVPAAEEPIPEAFPLADPDAQPVEVPEPVDPKRATFADIAFAATQKAPGSIQANLGVISLVLGIISLCTFIFSLCGAIVPVIGIILGVIGLKSKNKRQAMAGIVLSVIGLVLAITMTVLAIWLFLSLPTGN